MAIPENCSFPTGAPDHKFEVFATVKIQVEVFNCVVTPYGVAAGDQCFGGPYCLYLQGEVDEL
jgi:hypothetical protein